MTMRNSSTTKSYTRYNYGVVYLNHKGKNTTTSVGSEYDDFLVTLENIPSREGRMPKFVENRPDLVANIFHDSPGYWWYTMQYNSTFDPFEDLNAGDRINIPVLP